MVRQHLCDALHATGRIKEAGEALLDIVHSFPGVVYMAEPVVTWLSGRLCCLVSPLYIRHFATDSLQRCLSTERTDNSALPTPLLREWVQLQLEGGSWNDALTATRDVSISSCSGACWLDTPFLWSLRPRDLSFTGLFVIGSKGLARQPLQSSASTK